MTRPLSAAVVLFVLVLSTGADAQTGKSFMWKVEAQGGAVAYLLGSLHVLTPEWYPLSAAINKAFAESKVLVEEIDLDETSDPMHMMSALMKAMLPAGQTLDKVIAPELYAEVQRRAEKVGMPVMAVQRMKPWLVAITLMAPTLQAAGFKPELGIDRHFYDRAVASGMKRQALETFDYQLNRFDELPMKMQEDLLKATITDLDVEVKNVNEMAQAWSFGNVAAIEKLTLTALKEAPELYKRLLVERNHNWMPHVESCLKQNAGCFIVVGAAHLVGPDGLPTLLSQKGYKVVQQ
ncbi:MAG TPA: TraB/GumN family protein [Vicinamibacterales bacterium]|nr:TraB/GumN family protein [Vicinamibacterales bacterium]